MNTPFEEDQIVTFLLPFSKVICLLPLSEDKLFVIHHNYEFGVVKLERPKCSMLGMGALPNLSSQFKVYSKTQIIFATENQICIFDWIQMEIKAKLTIPKSQIYHQTYHYFLHQDCIVTWKTCQLLHDYSSITYQIDLYSRQDLQKLKKYKLNLKQPCQIVYCFGQVITFQTIGFQLHVVFLQSQLTHQIQSIYKMMFLESQILNDNLVLAYTHSQLHKYQQISYIIRENHVQKRMQKIRQPGVIRVSDRVAFEIPDLFKNKKMIDEVEVKLRIKYSQAFKYSALIGQFLKGQEDDLLVKEILELLGHN